MWHNVDCRIRRRRFDYSSGTPTNTTLHEDIAMKYLCLIYGEESSMAKMSQDDGAKMMADYGAYTQDIQKSGHYLGGNPLQPTSTATTVRIRNGKVSTTDGPFAETKEQLAGYYMIEAKDLNEAIQVGSRIPGARTGSIEVRPIRPM
jgi:hypothetical protein